MNTKGFASLQEAEAAIQRDMVELALQDLANAGFIEVETDEEGLTLSITDLGRADVAKRRAENHSLWQRLVARLGPIRNDQNFRNAVLDTIAAYGPSAVLDTITLFAHSARPSKDKR